MSNSDFDLHIECECVVLLGYGFLVKSLKFYITIHHTIYESSHSVTSQKHHTRWGVYTLLIFLIYPYQSLTHSLKASRSLVTVLQLLRPSAANTSPCIRTTRGSADLIFLFPWNPVQTLTLRCRFGCSPPVCNTSFTVLLTSKRGRKAKFSLVKSDTHLCTWNSRGHNLSRSAESLRKSSKPKCTRNLPSEETDRKSIVKNKLQIVPVWWSLPSV